nr:uncharacterized protein LOC118040656 [Populus alba]XP_034903534.1 uncharacterized protein LOC118040656 [Populus alba]
MQVPALIIQRLLLLQWGLRLIMLLKSQMGSCVFKISGYCHHLMGSLLPIDNQPSRFAQFYIFDTENEVSNRLHPFNYDDSPSTLNEDVVNRLITMLDSCNELVRLLRQVRHRLNGIDGPNFKLQLVSKRVGDSREYDDPSSNDMGGLVVKDIGDSQTDRDIIAESFSWGLQRTSKLHPKFMSLQYPLLFPYGEDGYHTDIASANQEQQARAKLQRVTMRACYD